MRVLALILLAACPRGPEPEPAPEGMVAIAGGEAWVGSPRVGPNPPPGGGPVVRARRRVRLSPYFIDRTEVTRAQYAAFLQATGYRLPSVDEGWAEEGYAWTSATPDPALAQHPVVLVSWYDASEYCRWRGARLPTDAEWERAALGAEGRAWPWGETWDPLRLNHGKAEAPFFDDSDGFLKTSPVGSYPAGATPEGLLDTFGDAWEWTADAWGGGWEQFSAAREGETLIDPHSEGMALYRGARGGSYYFDLTMNQDGERNGFLAELRRKTSGLRCARSQRAEGVE